MSHTSLFLKWQNNFPYFTDNRHNGDCVLLFFDRDLSDDVELQGTTLTLYIKKDGNALTVNVEPPDFSVLGGRSELEDLILQLNQAVRKYADFDLSNYVSAWNEKDPYFSFFIAGSDHSD
jgi:hypothetical protein